MNEAMIPDPSSAAQPAVKMIKATLHPDLEKYYKMLKMNIPQHAVENKMRQNGKRNSYTRIYSKYFRKLVKTLFALQRSLLQLFGHFNCKHYIGTWLDLC